MKNDVPWTEEEIDYLMQTKNMNAKSAYNFFCRVYPNRSYHSVYRRRARLNLVIREVAYKPKEQRALYSEHEKKGYVYIKVAQPATWVSKAKWLYFESQPWEYTDEKWKNGVVIFKDGNARNFKLDNLLFMWRNEMAVFAMYGGAVKGDPEQTVNNYARAKLKIALLNAGEKTGDTIFIETNGKKWRVSKKQDRERKRVYMHERYTNDPEYRKKVLEQNKAWQKANFEKVSQYKKEWQRRKKEKKC